MGTHFEEEEEEEGVEAVEDEEEEEEIAAVVVMEEAKEREEVEIGEPPEAGEVEGAILAVVCTPQRRTL